MVVADGGIGGEGHDDEVFEGCVWDRGFGGAAWGNAGMLADLVEF